MRCKCYEGTYQSTGYCWQPRHGSNTETLIEKVLHGAEEGNTITKKIILNELDIAPCQACITCQKASECIQKDDIMGVVEMMQYS